jgi:hypothetical protein
MGELTSMPPTSFTMPSHGVFRQASHPRSDTYPIGRTDVRNAERHEHLTY